MSIDVFKTRIFALFAAFIFTFVLLAPDVQAKKHVRVRQGKARTVTRAAGVNDARYADIIMNPVTGEVYHQHEPDARRYPASLTKMMTLYLLFEALEKHKTTLDARLDISDYAASMPQTNLSLTPGDTIEVETAIKALVVRSANDVSVVVGEALGDNVNNFATMMTAKARQLGMKNTVFRNPNGLPNNAQYTTARDMAKLGIALKRDFPKYYRYFSTLQFSHNGVTYYTHNRVMLRYAGVDGIKTGFIGLSGFNLVTSVVRGGRPLVGTVMGGATGGWRDNRMIELLDDSYKVVASRGAARGKMYPQNLPLAKNGKAAGVDGASIGNGDAPDLTRVKIPDNENDDGGETLPAAVVAERDAVRQPAMPVAQPGPFDAVDSPVGMPEDTLTPAPAPAAQARYVPALSEAPVRVVTPAAVPNTRSPIIISPPAPAHSGAVSPSAGPVHSKVIQLAATPSPAPQTLPADSPFARAPSAPETMIVRASPPAVPASPAAADATGNLTNSWGIQVGAFSTQALAVQATRTAMQVASKPLASAKMATADPAGGSVAVHRARLENLSQPDARKACEVLIANNSPCFIYRAAGDLK